MFYLLFLYQETLGSTISKMKIRAMKYFRWMFLQLVKRSFKQLLRGLLICEASDSEEEIDDKLDEDES